MTDDRAGTSVVFRGLCGALQLSQGLDHWVGCTAVWTLSPVQPFATPWTVAHQAPLSVAFSRQDSWRGLPSPSPGALPDPGTEGSPALAALSIPYPWATWAALRSNCTSAFDSGGKDTATPLLMWPHHMESPMKDVRNQPFLKNSRRYQFIYSIPCEVWTHDSWSHPTPPSVP